MSNESEKAITDASEQLAVLMRLPPASGTVRNIVDAIVRAAVAAIDERQAAKSALLSRATQTVKAHK
jgi:hypothetical protein